MVKLTLMTLGEQGVGKTTFALSAYEKRACTKHQCPTIEVEHHYRQIDYGGEMHLVKFRDTAGTEQYRSMTKQSIRGCDGAFLMFDEKHSWIEDLEYWRNFYEDNADNPEWVLVKTKCDDEKQQNCQKYVQFSKIHGKSFFKVSAREYNGVEEALEELVGRALQRRQRNQKLEKETVSLDMKGKKGGSCC